MRPTAGTGVTALAPRFRGRGCAVFVRFQGAVLLILLVAIGGNSIENAALDRRRAIGRQYYRVDVLQERVARLRLRTEELGAPYRLIRPAPDAPPIAAEARSVEGEQGVGPLLHWRTKPDRGR